MSTQWWALLATWAGVIVTGVVTLYNMRANRAKTEAETVATKTETALRAKEAAAFDEKHELEREQHWQTKLTACEVKFEKELSEVRDEVQMLRRFIERHVPWDWKAVRELRLLGSDIEDPPTLTYLREEK